MINNVIPLSTLERIMVEDAYNGIHFCTAHRLPVSSLGGCVGHYPSK